MGNFVLLFGLMEIGIECFGDLEMLFDCVPWSNLWGMLGGGDMLTRGERTVGDCANPSVNVLNDADAVLVFCGTCQHRFLPSPMATSSG